MLAKQKRDGFSNKELGELYGMETSEIEQLLDMRSYADDYLRSRGKANLWSHVSEHEFAFRKIVSLRPKLNGVGNKEVFKQAAFILIDKPEEAGGRLYEAIPSILESLSNVKEKLQEEFKVKQPAATTGLDELFGGTPTAPNDSSTDIPLANEIQKPENIEKARKIIVEVIESQRQLKKDAKSANYLLDCCAKAQALLTAAVKDGLRPESKLDGVAKQLDQITAQTGKIRAHLKAHAKS
jgi:hypothetical protein